MAMALRFGNFCILHGPSSMCSAPTENGKAPIICNGLARSNRSAHSISWNSNSGSFAKIVFNLPFQPPLSTCMGRLKIMGEKTREETNGSGKSKHRKDTSSYHPDSESKHSSQGIDKEKLFWDTFMRREVNEERALEARKESRESVASAQVATTILSVDTGTGSQDGNDLSVQKQVHIVQGKKFLFHSDSGGKVEVLVSKIATHYTVEIQAHLGNLFLDTDISAKLHWGLFRSDSKDWVMLEPEAAPHGTSFVDGVSEAMQTPLVVGPQGVQTLSLSLDAKQAPFFVSFLFFKPATANQEELWVRAAQGTNFCIPVGIGRGQPDPLGPTWERDGAVNFALYSSHAENVILCLYEADAIEPSLEIDLEPAIHRTGDVWHVQLESLGKYTRYGYRCKGQVRWETGCRFHSRYVLLDPYAKLVAPHISGQEDLPSPAPVLGWLKKESVPFDWEDEFSPRIPLEYLVAYRLNVVNFTGDESSELESDLQGTFLGLIKKVPHFLSLGVNALILQPVFAYETSRGCYYPVSFFSPMGSYGPSGDSLSASSSLKILVKELHRNGIEVILDVVYSHTAEGGDEAPTTISFRGIDNATYYILNQSGAVTKPNFGAQNSFNCNHPVVQKLITDSLRFWVDEFHVDGFCFTNASALLTGPHGQELSRPVLVEAITFDPVLAGSKLIADACSPISGICKDITFPHWKRWCEWNNQFRSDVRRFIRGEESQLSNFATRLCGSGDMFAHGRGTCYSINYVTAPYGLTLTDLVSYSEVKEDITEYSWNCGLEGPTDDPAVLEIRVKQVRNFLMTLFLSQGVPVLNMGDEYGHTKYGIDNTNHRTTFQWEALQSDFAQQTTKLISSLAAFRSRRKDLLQRIDFLELGMLTWHGSLPKQPLWEDAKSSLLAVSLHSQAAPEGSIHDVGDLYLGFNAHPLIIPLTLPEPPKGMIWFRIADTSLPYPENFSVEGVAVELQGESHSPFGTYDIQPYSSLVWRLVQDWHPKNQQETDVGSVLNYSTIKPLQISWCSGHVINNRWFSSKELS